MAALLSLFWPGLGHMRVRVFFVAIAVGCLSCAPASAQLAIVDSVELPAEHQEAIAELLRGAWRAELAAAEVHARNRLMRERRDEYHDQIRGLLDGTITPTCTSDYHRLKGIPLIRLPIGAGTATKTVVEVVSIPDEKNILVRLRNRSHPLGGTDVWVSGVDTSSVTSDMRDVPLDGWFVQLQPREYTTVLGATRKVHHLTPLSDTYFRRVWNEQWEEFSELVPTLHVEIERKAIKASRRR